MTCRCHAGHLYNGLIPCPKCGHRSYDPACGSCERHQCGYVQDTDPTKPKEAI